MEVYLIFTVINLFLAAWLAITSIAALHNKMGATDARPLVMPIFSSVAYFFLAFTWLAKAPEEHRDALEVIAWQMVHCGMLVGHLFFVKAYEHRGE